MKRRLQVPLAAALTAAALSGCSDSGQANVDSTTSRVSAVPGGLGALNAAKDVGRPLIIEDDSKGGVGSNLQLTGVAFGRLVELWGKDRDGGDVRVARDFVVGDGYAGDGVKTRLVTHPVLGIERLMIDEVVSVNAGGSHGRFLALAEAAAATAAPLSDAGADGSGTLSTVPRNAALVLQFNDLLDASQLAGAMDWIRVGSPAISPFEARTVASEMFGGFARRTGEFAPTRIIVDFTVDESEQTRSSTPLGTNGIGLPAGEPRAATGLLRLPTLPGAGAMITNLSGVPLGVSPGSIDYSSGTRDLVRPFAVGSDHNDSRGFLGDNVPPRLVARAEVFLTSAPVQQSVPDVFMIPRIQFASTGCAGPAQIGDILTQGSGVRAEVLVNSGPSTAAALDNVLVRLLEFPMSWPSPQQWEIDGAGQSVYTAPYDVAMDDARVACLVQVFPEPLGFPSAPTRGIATDATFGLRFNEAIHQTGSEEIEGVLIGRNRIAATGPYDPMDVVLSEADAFVPAPTDAVYAQKPIFELAHMSGTSEVYYITPRTGPDAIQDLAGNGLVESPGSIAMSVDPAEDPVASGSFLLGFASTDELDPAGVDLSGQVVRDFQTELIAPRPVVRSQGNVDNSQPLQQQQITFSQGVRTPHTPFGARMQNIWRYADMGLGLTDPNTINIDVEGLYWAPAGGTVTPDSFGEFEIALSHSAWAPDEVIDPASLFPRYSNSGLRTVFEANIAGDQEIVHRRVLGYTFGSNDVVLTPSGQPLVPFPQNRVTNEPTRTFTWRDTTIRERAGNQVNGVEPEAYFAALGLAPPTRPYYRGGEVQTLGLPLLLDIRNWPDPTAIGQTGWVLNLAVNSSSKPFFRAFSAGGVNTSGQQVLVDPSMETTANGGFSPGSTPPGQQTYGRDNSVMLGAADFVVRQSVAHTVWIDTGSDSPGRIFSEVTLPSIGTPLARVSTQIRGATAIGYDDSGNNLTDNDSDGNGVADMLEDALTLDLYGDFYNDDEFSVLEHNMNRQNPGVTFAGSVEDEWQADAADLMGARYVQLRLLFQSDVETGEVAQAKAVGIAWRD